MREEMTRSPMRLAVLYRLVARPVVLAVLVVLGIGYTLLFADSGTWHSYSINEALVHPSEPPVQPPLAPVSVSKVVVVPEPAPKPPPEPEPGVIKPTFKSAHPTEKFQDNLQDNELYITTFNDGGFNNQLMAIINLIYLGLLTSRTIVLPPFHPYPHLPAPAGYIPFSAAFDLPHLARTLDVPLLEWHDLKNLTYNPSQTGGPYMDSVGCWSVWATANGEDPRPSFLTHYLALDVSYTPINPSSLLHPKPSGDLHTSFYGLAEHSMPKHRIEALEHAKQAGSGPVESPNRKLVLEPDTQLLCFDFLYWVAARSGFEMFQPWSPAWRVVGRHIKFHPIIRQLTKELVWQTLAEEEEAEEDIPYIAVHMRRGDFGEACGGRPRKECLAREEKYMDAVEEIKRELIQRDPTLKGKIRVILVSDEKDQDWWTDMAKMGFQRLEHDVFQTGKKWVKATREFVRAQRGFEERFMTEDLPPDHERGNKRNGREWRMFGELWGPLLTEIEAVGAALGVVATDQSTFSLLAQRRSSDGKHGIHRTVQWGI